MPQDKRKSKRHFSLEKPVERRFEIEKDDVESNGSGTAPATNGSVAQQPSSQGVTTISDPGTNPDPTTGGSNRKAKWIAAALAAGLIGGGAYYLWPKSDGPAIIDDNNQPKTAQIAKIDVNGDGVIDINDNPTQDTNGDGVIDMYDAAKDTNGDGVVDAADAAVADSNGDKIIDEKDKSSGDMLFEKPFNPEVDQIAKVDVNGDGVVDVKDNPTKDTNGDGIINYYDAGKDTNGDGMIDAADAAVVDSNGDGVIDAKDKLSGDMLRDKNNPRENVDISEEKPKDKAITEIVSSTNGKPESSKLTTSSKSDVSKSAIADEPSNVKNIQAKQQSQTINLPVQTDQSVNVSGTIHELALRAIRGEFGNAPDRRRILGDSYKKVQKEINKIYRKRNYRHKYRRNYRRK